MTYLLGRKVKVVDHSSDQYKGINGIAKEESKNTFKVGSKTISKKTALIEIRETGEIINGSNILKRPVET